MSQRKPYAESSDQNQGPILEVLRHENLTDCVCVVTRYFGGILLGAGGLVRAYSHSCALALAAAGVCDMLPTQRWLHEVAYPLWDRVQHTLKALPVQLVETEYAATVNFTLLCRSEDGERVQAELARVTDGRIESLLDGEDYLAWEEAATPPEG